ncbi:MAG: gamma carbonic anhydrase family protein [Nitrososphaerales archaeon]
MNKAMPLLPYEGVMPRIDESAYVADGAYIVGNVDIGGDASIWYNAVLRGDINSVRIGARTNIQDGSILHVTNKLPVRVGADVTVGHRAIIHGSIVEDCCLIGMGSVILDNARVGPYALVAAGAVVLENFVVPEGMLAAGVPARIIRPLTEAEKKSILQSAQHYVEYAQCYRS